MFTLGSFDLTASPGVQVTGKITREMTDEKLIVLQNPYALEDTQIAHVFNGILKWTVPLRLFSLDGTGNDLAILISQLNAELVKEGNTLYDQLDRGVDVMPITEYRTHRSKPIFAGRDELTEKRLTVDTTIVIRTAPTGTASEPVDITPDDVTRIGLVSLGALAGDADASLTVTVASTSPDWLSAVIVALAGANDVIGDFDHHVDQHIGGGDDPGYVDITVSRAGHYRVAGFVSAAGSANFVRLGIGQGAASAPYWSTNVSTDGDEYLADLGEFSSSGSTNLRLMTTTAGRVYLDHVVLVPVDVGCTSAWGLSNDTDSVTFVRGANSAPMNVVGDGLVAPLNSPQLLVVVSSELTGAVTVSPSYTPAWWSWAYTPPSS